MSQRNSPSAFHRPTNASNERRTRSFVIIGLPELPSQLDDEKAAEDLQAAIDIVRHLGIEDAVIQRDVRRVGSGPPGQRNLLVTLQSIESRNRLLARAHFLGDHPDTSDLRIDRAYTFENNPRVWYGEAPALNHSNPSRNNQQLAHRSFHPDQHDNHSYNAADNETTFRQDPNNGGGGNNRFDESPAFDRRNATRNDQQLNYRPVQNDQNEYHNSNEAGNNASFRPFRRFRPYANASSNNRHDESPAHPNPTRNDQSHRSLEADAGTSSRQDRNNGNFSNN